MAGEYLRLSKERKGQRDVSDSIENQRLVISRFFERNPDVKLVADYIDDGYTGLDYDRQAFERMSADLESGRINMIVTKDLSRLGREQIQTLQLVTLSFVERQVRYVAVEDSYDSFINPDTTVIEMKAFMNNYYSADNSRKVRAVQRAKREQGDFIGAFAPYGYRKDPMDRNRLLIDEEAASVVRKIYDLYIMGNGLQTIARILNSKKVLPPTAYKQFKQNLAYKNGLKYETTKYWTYSSVRRILTHEVYIGNMVQHTIEKITYKSKKMRAVPKEKQCIVENTHEPVISRNQFNLVQDMIRSRARDMGRDHNAAMFAGLFFCGDCRRRMCRFYNGTGKDGRQSASYKCASYSQYGKEICSIHSVKEEELSAIVLRAIYDNAVKALRDKDYKRLRAGLYNRKRNPEEQALLKLQQDRKQLEKRHARMLMNLSDDIITREEFMLFTKENRQEKEELDRSIRKLQEELQENNACLELNSRWVEDLISHGDIKELRREILVNLVQRIEIYEDGCHKNVEKNTDEIEDDNDRNKKRITKEKRIEITFRFRNPFEET